MTQNLLHSQMTQNLLHSQTTQTAIPLASASALHAATAGCSSLVWTTLPAKSLLCGQSYHEPLCLSQSEQHSPELFAGSAPARFSERLKARLSSHTLRQRHRSDQPGHHALVS